MFILSSAACFFWGAAATYCFFNAWLALIGVIASIIGLMRRQVAATAFLRLLYAQVTTGAVHGLALVLVFAICWQRLQLGRTRLGTAISTRQQTKEEVRTEDGEIFMVYYYPIMGEDGADLAGIAEVALLEGLPTIPYDLLNPYRFAVSLAVALPRAVFSAITDAPTPEYGAVYQTVNRHLDDRRTQ